MYKYFLEYYIFFLKYISHVISQGKCNPFYYWNISGLMCIPQLTNGISCLSNEDCLSYSGLYCSTTCRCLSNYYWASSSTSCGWYLIIFKDLKILKLIMILVKRASYGEMCNTSTVDVTLLLTCNSNGYSVCNGSLFWNGTYCGMV